MKALGSLDYWGTRVRTAPNVCPYAYVAPLSPKKDASKCRAVV